ncbi:MAG: hypothetical protein JNN20_08340 [Betaproteobacteria bacterium]|nr:hypothetical protein [Betaproteobacteria bacterium]
MNPKFIWTTELPKDRDQADVEETAWAVIELQPDPENRVPTIRTIHLGCRFMGYQGVAFNENDEPVFAFTYFNGVSRACYFDAPDKVRLLGLGS